MPSLPPSWRSAILRGVGVVALVAALLPPALVVRTWLPFADDLDVPHWDQWELVPLIEAAIDGTLRPRHLWTQDGETRLVVPRLAVVGLALATGWDIRAEIVLNLALGVVTVGCLAGLMRLTIGAWCPALVPWLVLAASAIVFSLGAYEAWFWGWSFTTLTSAASVCLAMFALAWRGRQGAGPWLAVLAAIVATFSFSNGLLLLVLVPLGLFLDPRPAATAFARRAPLAAGVVCAAVVVAYFTGFAYPRALAVPATLAHPGAFVAFLLVYLGAPFGGLSPLPSALAGGAGVAIGVGTTAWLWVRRPERRATLMPWLLLGTFAFLAAVMTTIGRWRFGADHALTSRYQTFSALFWITVLVLAAAALREVAAGSARRRAIVRSVAAVAACVAAVAYVDTWTASAERLRTRVEALRRGRECVLFHAVAPRDCLALIYPDPDIARRRAARLEALALGPFRPGARPRALATYAVVADAPPGSVDAVQSGPALLVNPVSAAYRATEIIVSGRAAHEVLVVVDGQIAGRTRPHDGAWMFRFGAFRLAPGPHSIEGYAMLGDGRVARLARGWSITVAPPPPRS